jgi:hypothetical protein
MGIEKATRSYEAWLGGHTALVKPDLDRKHTEMARESFPFFRATYYRWAQLWPEVCGELAAAPPVLAVGDLHVENFGTWRDAEGRLAWGVNDFDEVYPLAYTNDLVRLATSTLLADRTEHGSLPADVACEALLSGYGATLQTGGCPFILGEHHRRLAYLFGHQARDPRRFWLKIRELPPPEAKLPGSALSALKALLPEREVEFSLARRVAGLGSLGKQRFVAFGTWHGGAFAREAKAVTPSAAAWAADDSKAKVLIPDLVRKAVRAPDPFWTIHGSWVVRRLSPDCGRVELTALRAIRDDLRLLRAMGAETANVHLGTRGARKTIRRDLDKRPAGWLCAAAQAMLDATLADWHTWRDRRG